MITQSADHPVGLRPIDSSLQADPFMRRAEGRLEIGDPDEARVFCLWVSDTTPENVRVGVGGISEGVLAVDGAAADLPDLMIHSPHASALAAGLERILTSRHGPADAEGWHPASFAEAIRALPEVRQILCAADETMRFAIQSERTTIYRLLSDNVETFLRAAITGCLRASGTIALSDARPLRHNAGLAAAGPFDVIPKETRVLLSDDEQSALATLTIRFRDGTLPRLAERVGRMVGSASSLEINETLLAQIEAYTAGLSDGLLADCRRVLGLPIPRVLMEVA